MQPVYHITFSMLISGILYIIFKSWGLAIASLISGTLIDLDHVIDYLLEHKFRFNRKDFFAYYYEERLQKAALIFHGWEWIILLITGAIMTDWNQWVVGFLIGYAHHIFFDIIHNNPTLTGLSLFWRIRNNFDVEVIYPKNRKKFRCHSTIDELSKHE